MIADTVLLHWKSGRTVRTTPSGWIAGNAVCCNDTRMRGGLIIGDHGAFSYSCFNCKFKTSWNPGRKISSKLRKFMRMLDIDNATILRLCAVAEEMTDVEIKHEPTRSCTFDTMSLPIGSRRNNIPIRIQQYIKKRTLQHYELYWSPLLSNRIIVPFYYNNKIVGYSARSVDNTIPKYIAEQQPGYLFNIDHQYSTRKYVIVTEGIMDALATDGVALLGNKIHTYQHEQLTALDKHVILVPDRDTSGRFAFDQALEYGWSVSMPQWPHFIHDAADAMQYYGKVYTVWSILNSLESSTLKLNLKAKTWFGQYETKS